MKLNKTSNKFYFEVDKNNWPRIDYIQEGHNYILLYCEVPPALRGQSWGKKIVNAVKAYIESEGAQITEVRCGYIKKVLSQN